MIIEKLKFYADTGLERNQFFCWNVSILNLQDALFRFFAKGWVIRAAWYHSFNTDTDRVVNQRINVQEQFNRFCALSPKEREIYFKVQVKSSFSKPSPNANIQNSDSKKMA